MVRHVLRLPKKDDEAAFKIELIAGKTVMVTPFSPSQTGSPVYSPP
jgi:serine protease inhibitor ecotin